MKSNLHTQGDLELPKTTRERYFGSVSVFHMLVVVLSLAMTLSVWQYSKAQAKARTQARFDRSVDQVLDLIRDRMGAYEDALWAGVSTVESHGGDISRDRWHVFAKTLRLEEKYPGINGIGVIHFVPRPDRASYLVQRRSERPGFQIFPEHPHDLSMPISFIEPEAENAKALGLDVAHELNRRTAALASRDTGTAQITGPIVLVQDATAAPGFLFYAPFYEINDSGQPQINRQASARGAVYAPFVMEKLMNGLLAAERRDVRFSIQDETDVLFDEHARPDETTDANPMFTKQVTLDIYGRSWTLDLRSNAIFRAQNAQSQPTFILIAGLMIEALVIALLFMMSRANTRAVAYADKVTKKLQTQTTELEQTNKELEQFAYVASHDLKTPLRGIGVLAGMVKEDLEGHVACAETSGEIGKNLDLILERVDRMYSLTDGIMEFSRVGFDDTKDIPLELENAMDTMATDFGLDRGTLILTSDTEAIGYDPFNLRRILENLVGNAIKYHDGLNALRIEIGVVSTPEQHRIFVRDNGPGIAPQYHDRIFDVFQTLRLNDAPQSTGIGLAIVKKSIERHGGQITVQPSSGGGVTFVFTWPAQAHSEHTELQDVPLAKTA